MNNLLKVCLCIPVIYSVSGWTGTTWVDVRGAHNIRADTNETRIKFMHQATNGFYFSAEATQSHNESFFGDEDSRDGKEDGVTGVSQEIETRWQFPLGNGYSIAPGLTTVFTKTNTHYRPFIQGWKAFDNGINLAARYRYNTVNDAHSDRKLGSDEYTRRKSHQFDIWIAYNIGRFGMSWNPRFRYQDGVDQGTGRDTYWEHTLAFSYKMDDDWTPYIELGSLDKTYVDDHGTHKNEFVGRLGITKKL
ncbi:hypothetical protein SMY44_003607 [Cronobacter sakazakii]|uniref:oligogalacturonate-specific porin KdgM family protein n=1 Tax=Cronobacter sakazakii TaxID=28141 RepID=UPI0018F874E5|nr:oligogalacturonate-specific porin KdgM family protein [Cronobacter sakazakii]ELY3457085.1 hypothetical protein [Cronobacter sakazakii]ELY4031258.1 hypothetical protein [Cronobacter sakazakii]